MTIELIEESPLEYHSNTGALIMGNAQVTWLPQLLCGKKEAEMVGRLMDVALLVRERAMKQAALVQIIPVSLIHFAAHGNAKRVQTDSPDIPKTIPQWEAYMWTMADIS